ncbi:MAG TPA: Rieske 2Fe-2S domain-containing protein [Stellaceae bacterium]|nr:Rieske 2Fe-2S domain-containing protein [Stellaceae bacterium]
MRQKDSDDLVRVGPGTTMGKFMRQYWLPAAMSSELKADGEPMRLMLLGEQLIAFRDSAGRVGVMDHKCPHRCASLFLGRNEGNGIRCVYHGWKFDVEGNCVDMPSVPPERDFKHLVHAKAYKAVERNGLVWVYMGDRKSAPALPQIEATLLPDTEVTINLVQRECNWLQALEGDIDTCHFGFLHAGSVTPEMLPTDSIFRYTVTNRAPDYHVADTDTGTMYAAFREAEQTGSTYWRFANFMLPFWTQTPQGKFTEHLHNRAWVPMDDTHTMFVSLTWKRHPPSITGDKNGQEMPGFGRVFEYQPNTTDWYGRWRLARNGANDWLIDRDAQANGGNYTGISGIHAQDQAVTESMGPITDHLWEHLGPSDMMIMRTRRRLLAAARAFAKSGKASPGVDNPEIMYPVRSGDFVTEAGLEWRQAYDRQMAASVRPLQQAAE